MFIVISLCVGEGTAGTNPPEISPWSHAETSRGLYQGKDNSLYLRKGTSGTHNAQIHHTINDDNVDRDNDIISIVSATVIIVLAITYIYISGIWFTRHFYCFSSPDITHAVFFTIAENVCMENSFFFIFINLFNYYT